MDKKAKFDISVFCDFDGTVAVNDVGNEFFKRFGEFEPFHTELINGDISIKNYYNKVIESLKIGLTSDEIENFALENAIDPYFLKFFEFCFSKNIDVTIVSDGFDVYIKPILKKNKLENLKIFCNLLFADVQGRIKPVFPLADESCNCNSASCKRNAMLSCLDENTISVFVGDGFSDYCIAEHADVVFAKKNLAAYCNEKRIPHYPFSNFFDVYRILSNAIVKNKIKKRHQAELLRRKAFITE